MAAKSNQQASSKHKGAIPSYLIEYFLLGQTRPGETERYTQDGGIVLNVWLKLAQAPFTHQRVLIAPHTGVSTIQLGAALHHALVAYRKSLPKKVRKGRFPPKREPACVSPLENYVAATIYLDELLRVVLPMTQWWDETNLRAVHRKALRSEAELRLKLEQAIRIKLGGEKTKLRELRGQLSEQTDQVPPSSPEALEYPHWRIIDAAPIAAMIGLFVLVSEDPGIVADVPEPLALKPVNVRRTTPEPPANPLLKWLGKHAAQIAAAATSELARPFQPALFEHARKLFTPAPSERDSNAAPTLIQRVFLDRVARLAVGVVEGVSTIKADAATRLFEVACTSITWGIIDSGIASTHPAFKEHQPSSRPGNSPGRSRVRATFDFTLISKIRNFDLISNPPKSAERRTAIRQIARELDSLPGRKSSLQFRKNAEEKLKRIAEQLDADMQPDWLLIEPLIRISDDDGSGLESDHGTHVAGILGGDWRKIRKSTPPPSSPRTNEQPAEEVILQGVCPDINLYDLRVVEPSSLEGTEFALLAAIEYIQHINQRAASNGPVVHGVNISMSIPHDVRNYGCGSTPLCIACDRLSDSGVVVVAAAGNRGWNEQEIGFGSFVFCSITDPGNARQVITVGATHRSNPHTYGVSYFSSRGPTGDGRIKPDIVAPGEKIRGPIRGNADDRMDGTSMAAPFVSGAAAMLLARHRELIGKPARVKEVLCRSATDLGREKYFQGCGLVDVLRALQSI